MRWLKYTLFFINHFILSINAQDFSVGTWRDHLPYSEFNQVVQVGNFFYASTPYSIVEFDNSNNEVLVKVKRKIIYEDLLISNPIPLSTAAFNSEKLGIMKFRDIELSEDWLYWLDIFKNIGNIYAPMETR